jgi:signal transduction histidine kinase
VSAPILVQGSTAGILQALMPMPTGESNSEPSANSLTIVCQELGTSVEKALLREAAQRSLVLEEKNRIARELHDTVLQILFSLGLGVDWCLQRASEDDRLGQKLTDMRRLTAEASNELRSAIYTLSSTVAERGLMPALEALTTDFTEQHGLPVSLSTMGEPPLNLPVLTQNALHRVVRESLMNTYKHARAGHAAVRIVFEPASIVVVIQDDGVGLPHEALQRYAEDPTHFGLRTVRRQIEELDGQFEIMNGEEGGTVVRTAVPIYSGTQEVGGDRRTHN